MSQVKSQVLQQYFEQIMATYLEAKAQDGYSPAHPVSAQFEELRLLLEQHAHQTGREHLQLEWSVGRGQWAHIPWFAIFDERETTRARAGVYITYLFREDMSAVYVALGHGSLALVQQHGTKKAYEILGKRLKTIRAQVRWLTRSGFSLADDMDLRSSGKLGRDYEHSIIAHKRYDLGRMPEDAQIIADLDELFDAYEAYVEGDTGQGAQLWLLDAPQGDASLEAPQTILLKAKDPAPQIGDRVLLWGARDKERGVMGTARVVSVATGKKRREVNLGLGEVLIWPDVLNMEAWEEAGLEPQSVRQPTSRYALSPLSFEAEQLAMSWHQDHLASFDLGRSLGEVLGALEAQGWRFEPWQVAAYVVALRTKPFVILAGVSGTGKSRLPALIAQLTGQRFLRQPVRPDWSDSAELLGYTDLKSQFRPGRLLEEAQRAMTEAEHEHVFLLDEMNLARVEQYLAEFLSAIEDRRPLTEGGWRSGALLAKQEALDAQGRDWSGVYVPPNLALVGTVNMDETTFGFSRKVLDRAFTLEISQLDLSAWRAAARASSPRMRPWPLEAWLPRATRLAELEDLDDDEIAAIERAITALEEANRVLVLAQLQVGYRVRDEVALFVLHAQQAQEHFVDRDGERVDALDLALAMKLLPRIVGGSVALRRVLLGLLGWAFGEDAGALDDRADAKAQAMLEAWRAAGRPWAVEGARFARCASRLLMMWERLLDEGYTSYWV